MLLPLTAAAALAACSSDSDDFGEPFALTERDGGSAQPGATAGRSGNAPSVGADASVANAAGGGGGAGHSSGGNAGASGRGTAAGNTPAAGSGGGSIEPTHAGVGGSTAGSGGAGHAGQAGNASNAGAGSQAAAVSFNDIYTGILATGCSCHSGGAGGLDLGSRSSAYTNLVSVASTSCPSEQRVVPGNPSASVLLHSLAHTSPGACVVPSMPRGGGAMPTQAQLDQIAAWISAGARND